MNVHRATSWVSEHSEALELNFSKERKKRSASCLGSLKQNVDGAISFIDGCSGLGLVIRVMMVLLW